MSAKYYEHEPKTVTVNNEVTILLHMPIQTDRETRANRSHIVMNDKKGRNCQLLEISVPTESNTSIEMNKELSKYKDLEIEIERLWGMKATTKPVIIGALGLIKTGMQKYISKLPGNISIQEA